MAKDPYRYFRVEAQELTEQLASGLLELERGQDAETVRRLLRHAHTLKGASRVVRQTAIAELAHSIEDRLSPHREDGSAPIPRESIDEALAMVDAMRGHIPLLDAPKTAQPMEAPAEETLRSVRVAVANLDRVLAGIAEAAAALASEGREELDGVRTVLGALYERVTELRLIPATAIASDLERATRDASRALDKQVAFRARGTETRVDADVLVALRGALVHAVQNAVAHGIEHTGTVELSIERRAHRVVFSVTDDGGGFDLAEIRRIAVERGRIDAATARSLQLKETIELLYRGGLSTSRSVSPVSGRGVGLDAIRAAVEHVKGELEVKSGPGGTTISMIVPISLSSLPALSVEASGSTVLIPLDAVRHALLVREEDVTRSPEGARTRVGGEIVPLISLSRALGRAAAAPSAVHTAVVIESGGRRAALEVDRLGAIENVLVRSLPPQVLAKPIVAGAVLDAHGVPQLLLAPPVLTEAPLESDPPAVEPEKPAEVLVIDDSLTTRMLEQSILETAGYRVDLAVSGEDALVKAAQKAYRLFIVDVEMPGMDGFEFITRVKQDPALRKIPAILVTSRADAEDRRRGNAAGAQAYMVKSDFDQRALLETIRRLVD